MNTLEKISSGGNVKMENDKEENSKLKLHMSRKLQVTSKSAFQIFDYIHSLDSQKLADIFQNAKKKIQKN